MQRGSSSNTPGQRREDAAFAAAAGVRRRAVASGVLVLIASGIVLFCCSRAERPPREPSLASGSGRSPAWVEPVPEHAPAPDSAIPSATPTPHSAGRLAPVSSAAEAADRRASELGVQMAAAGSSAGGGARIVDAVASSDPRDLALLSRIERELGRTPPPAVHAILRRRREGAPRGELLSLARALPELPLRVHVMRWIDEVSPAP
jgi:hypothetical protein